MASLKHIRLWIACLAVLLNMFAMPLSRAMQTPDVHLMLWGGFCSGGSSQAIECERVNDSVESVRYQLIAI